MSADLSKQTWVMLAVTTPFIAGMTHMAINSVRSGQPVMADTRDVSFKVVFDDRVGFPQTIRQSTIQRLLGLEYEIVVRNTSAERLAGYQPAETNDERDCQIDRHGGLLTLRVPQAANSAEIAGRLEQLSRVKSVTFVMK